MEHLSESEKKDVSQFVQEEQQRAAFQQQIHLFTDVCWDKCLVNSKVKSGLDRYDEACISQCVERFVDSTKVIVNVFNQVAKDRNQ
ncbi:Mitochondrial import inner membrane translocase subunit Tim8 B [Physocladia obscura]|uniref:Mitochondrial import inner membrane translocase subunit n=1 Tax=Physocladia obscura TaxID=109957 RepID=A0AAD5ST70_9FUNG|nr:Mitochondrial import inner membrane translocase subunit Tim8 B [Physocladia obscura]